LTLTRYRSGSGCACNAAAPLKLNVGFKLERHMHSKERKMSESLRNVLTEAINDEYKARATYRHVIDTFGEIRPFINIVEAEGRHIEALLPLFRKYGIDVPEDDWYSRITPPLTLIEACRTGVEAEIENAEMYSRLLDSTTDYPDVQHVLMQLQRASAENHLPAFQRCLDRGGEPGKGRGRQHRGGRHSNQA
jgi:hypothetical protein